MKSNVLAISIATLVTLQACGGGSGDTAVSGPTPTPAPNPTPAPAPQPTPVPAPTPTTGADIDMDRAFNQQVECKYGIKPYFEPADSGTWTLAFDGDNFSLQSANGQQQFGGSFKSSGNPPDREDYAGAALYRTTIGAAGGQIYFTKTLTEQIIAAGHNKFTNNSRPDSVECAGNSASEWVARPTGDSPFNGGGDTLNFRTGTIEMNCTQRASDGAFGEPVRARAIMTDAGSVQMQVSGNALFGTTDFNAGETSKPLDSGVIAPGGQRIYRSVDSGNTIQIDLRYDDLIRNMRYERADGGENLCTPEPIDPRA